MTPEDLAQLTAIVTTVTTQRLDRAVESIAAEFSNLRAEINSRFESITRRLDRLAESVAGIHQQLAGMHRWADSLDSDNQKIHESLHQHDRRLHALEERFRQEHP